MDLHCLDKAVQGYFTAALAQLIIKHTKQLRIVMLLSVKVLELTLFQYRKALYATT